MTDDITPAEPADFSPGGAAAALTAASYQKVIGANDRIGLGFIGFGLIGKRHVLDFQKQPDASLVALAEVHRGRLDEGAALIGGECPKVWRLPGLARRSRRRCGRRLDPRPLARA